MFDIVKNNDKRGKVLVLKICDFVVVLAIVGDKCEEEMQGVSH